MFVFVCSGSDGIGVFERMMQINRKNHSIDFHIEFTGALRLVLIELNVNNGIVQTLLLNVWSKLVGPFWNEILKTNYTPYSRLQLFTLFNETLLFDNSTRFVSISQLKNTIGIKIMCDKFIEIKRVN